MLGLKRDMFVNQTEEKKLLKQILAAATNDPSLKWSWQAFALNAISFCVLTVIALWLIQNPHLADVPRVVSLLAAAIAGSMIGALSTWKLLCKNGSVVRKYIDVDRVRSRLAQLES